MNQNWQIMGLVQNCL